MAPDNLGKSPNTGFRLPGVPVFVYHGLVPAGRAAPAGLSPRSRKYWIGADQFRSELMAILRTGDVESLQDFLSNTADTDSALSAVLTFDDGNLSDYTLAFPLLLELGVPAQFFVNTATVDTPGHLSWSQLREMSEHGMGIGSHAHDHRYLTQCDLGELNRQLSLSKKTIEERVGREVSFLAVPYGDYNRRVITSVKEVGYRAICTGRSWPARWASEVIDRTIVHGFTSQVEFEKLFSRDLFTYGRRAARAAIISLPKQVWLQLRFRGWNPRGEEVLS